MLVRSGGIASHRIDASQISRAIMNPQPWWNCRQPYPEPASMAPSKTPEPLADIGFEGKGGKYLVLPPDFKEA